jgi:hypothetical protein
MEQHVAETFEKKKWNTRKPLPRDQQTNYICVRQWYFVGATQWPRISSSSQRIPDLSLRTRQLFNYVQNAAHYPYHEN